MDDRIRQAQWHRPGAVGAIGGSLPAAAVRSLQVTAGDSVVAGLIAKLADRAALLRAVETSSARAWTIWREGSPS